MSSCSSMANCQGREASLADFCSSLSKVASNRPRSGPPARLLKASGIQGPPEKAAHRAYAHPTSSAGLMILSTPVVDNRSLDAQITRMKGGSS